jgi:hypothetical protein
LNSTVNGFFGQAVYTYIKSPVWEDDLGMPSCDYAFKVDNERWKNDSTYID